MRAKVAIWALAALAWAQAPASEGFPEEGRYRAGAVPSCFVLARPGGELAASDALGRCLGGEVGEDAKEEALASMASGKAPSGRAFAWWVEGRRHAPACASWALSEGFEPSAESAPGLARMAPEEGRGEAGRAFLIHDAWTAAASCAFEPDSEASGFDALAAGGAAEAQAAVRALEAGVEGARLGAALARRSLWKELAAAQGRAEAWTAPLLDALALAASEGALGRESAERIAGAWASQAQAAWPKVQSAARAGAAQANCEGSLKAWTLAGGQAFGFDAGRAKAAAGLCPKFRPARR